MYTADAIHAPRTRQRQACHVKTMTAVGCATQLHDALKGQTRFLQIAAEAATEQTVIEDVVTRCDRRVRGEYTLWRRRFERRVKIETTRLPFA